MNIRSRYRFVALLFPILAFALTVRFLVAPHPGHRADMRMAREWVQSAAHIGVAASYAQQTTDGLHVPEQGPVEIAIFAMVGNLYRWLVAPVIPFASGPSINVFVKLPGIVADMGIIILLYFLLRKRHGENGALIASALYAIHPAVIYDSAIWGQTDALYTLLLLASIALFFWNRWVLLGIALALATFTKLQAVFLVTFFIFLCAYHWRAAISTVLTYVAITLFILLPFIRFGNTTQFISTYVQSMGVPPHLTLNAFNFWWALFNSNASTMSDTGSALGLLSFRTVGLLLFSLFYALVLALLEPLPSRSPKRQWDIDQLLIGAGLIASAFFLFSTEMHERCFFPAIVFLLPLIFRGWRGALLYGIISVLFLFNLVAVLPLGQSNPFSTIHILSWTTSILQLCFFFVAITFLIDQRPLARGNR